MPPRLKRYVGQALVFLADQVTGCISSVAKYHDARRDHVDTKLALDRDVTHVVARARQAIRFRQELGYDEQRGAFYAFESIGRAQAPDV